MHYEIIPRPFVQRTYQGRFSPKAKKYHTYLNQLRILGIELPDCGAHITFHLPMPKSWPKKKKEAMNCTPHQQAPDLSKLLRALEDAVRPRIKGDPTSGDENIWQYGELEKLWSYKGGITIVVMGSF